MVGRTGVSRGLSRMRGRQITRGTRRIGKIIKEVGRRREEQAAGDGRGEIEDAVGIARRFADEHAGQHSLSHARPGRVGDVVGAELPAPYLAEWHVGPDDLSLGPVRLY